ncbi:MAG: AmmeMemoRadiSam system protein B [Candidatus Woesearchaeota archaeon]
MRKPAVAGMFYQKGEVSLQRQVQGCFEGERGPGAVPPALQKQKQSEPPKAVIAPHAGYDYSGECAAWAYKAVGDAPKADVYVILAPSHKALRSGLTQQTFETPLGMVRTDQDLARRLLEKGTIREDDGLHEEEHAIEVQLPFLQFVQSDVKEQIKILPVLVSHDLDLQQFSIDLKEVLVDTGKKAVFIVSTDFTHYGRNYRYVPFSSNIQENIARLDKGALDLIKQGDAEGLQAYVEEHLATICGSDAIALLLKTVKFSRAHLEQYYTSAVVTGDERNSVSYASVVFR